MINTLVFQAAAMTERYTRLTVSGLRLVSVLRLSSARVCAIYISCRSNTLISTHKLNPMVLDQACPDTDTCSFSRWEYGA